MWGLRQDTTTRIRAARAQIAALFVQQCAHGAQSKTLPEEMAACGQFVGSEAADVQQRGLHGTAAALRVLAQSDLPDAKALVPRLVRYVERYEALATQPGEPEAVSEKVTHATTNVIKVAEVLYALSFVQASHGDIHPLVERLAHRLLSGAKEGKGWGYFLDSAEAPEPLPTAYAVRGLNSHGYNVTKQSAFLESFVAKSSDRQSHASSADFTTRVAVLFALSFSNARGPNGTDQHNLPHLLEPLWKVTEGLLTNSFERN